MEFIVPGLIMMSVITNSYSNVASSFYSAKFQRNVEELLVAPVPNYIIIAGYVGGGVTRASVSASSSLWCRCSSCRCRSTTCSASASPCC